MKKTPKWVPIAALVGGAAGVFYLLTNSTQATRSVGRATTQAASRYGLEVPGALADRFAAAEAFTYDERRVATYGAQLAEILGNARAMLAPVEGRTSTPNASGSPFGVQYEYRF